MRRAAIVLAVCLASGGAWAAGDDAKAARLKGVYAWSGVRTCVQARGLNDPELQGFTGDPDFALTPEGAPGSTRSAHYSGKLTLRGDGTGTMEFQTLQIFHQATAAGSRPVNLALNACEVTHGPNPDGTFWLDTKNCTATIEAGAGVGSTAEVLSAPSPLRVAATPDKTFLQMDDANLVVERSMQSPSPLPYLDRICGRYFTAVLLTRSLAGP